MTSRPGLGLARAAALTGIASATVALAGCATPGADARSQEWRAILAAEAPIGAPAAAGEAALRRNGLAPTRGTYVRIGSDGAARSDCDDPRRAITARERSAGRGVLARLDVEVTLCVDGAGRIERHVVKVWNQGL